MARKRGTSGRNISAQGFMQKRDTATNQGNQLVRSMLGSSGNTGTPEIGQAYKRKKATASANGSPLNFARRLRRRDAAQRPFVSNRQYAQAPLAPIA